MSRDLDPGGVSSAANIRATARASAYGIIGRHLLIASPPHAGRLTGRDNRKEGSLQNTRRECLVKKRGCTGSDPEKVRRARRRDSHPHLPRYGLGAFLVSRHAGQEQRDKDSNPVRRLWRPRALPGASLFESRRLAPRVTRLAEPVAYSSGGTGGVEPLTSAFTEPRANPLHHRPHRPSDPGWNRTTDLLRVREAPSPLGHRISRTVRGQDSNPERQFEPVMPV